MTETLMSSVVPDPAFEWISHNEEETARLGEELARILGPGAVVALVGDLGAGKTRLVQAVAQGLGIERSQVSSPTFTLVHEYDGRVPVFHFDTYRLKTVEEFIDLGSDEMLTSGGISFIEWADSVRNVLPPDVLWIKIDITGPSERRFRVTGTGPTTQRLVRQLSANLGQSGR